MRHVYPDPISTLPSNVTLACRRAVRLEVGALDALATVEARRLVDGEWSDWRPVVGLLEGNGTVWCGAGCVLQVRAANHSALVIEDDLAPAELPRIATVTSALEWLGLPTSGSRSQVNARLEEAP